MQIRILMTTLLVALTTGCASQTKSDEFKNGATDCAMICKSNPEIKEYSQNQGGGFFLILFGSEGKKCTCNR